MELHGDIKRITELTLLLMALIAFMVTTYAVFAVVNSWIERPMPCGKEYVYVWDDYPDHAKCVSQDDHHMHGG